LNGLNSYSYFFKSDDLVNPDMYNGWDFRGPEGAKKWDSINPEDKSFWYSKNTTILWYTEKWTLGKEQIATMGLTLTPSTFVEKDKTTTFALFGIIPLSHESRTYKMVDWTGETKNNKDLRVPLKPAALVNGTDMIANINYEFTERQYTLNYFGFKDILATVGGMRSSVLPIIGLLLPFLGLWFLMLIADIIIRNAAKNQQAELFKLAKTCHK
jgi:hypothetical protein